MGEVSFGEITLRCQWTLQMISQHWFRYWLGASRHQANTWTNFDQVLWRIMVSLGHTVFIVPFFIHMGHLLIFFHGCFTGNGYVCFALTLVCNTDNNNLIHITHSNPYPSELLQWHWGNQDCPSASEVTLNDMGKGHGHQITKRQQNTKQTINIILRVLQTVWMAYNWHQRNFFSLPLCLPFRSQSDPWW